MFVLTVNMRMQGGLSKSVSITGICIYMEEAEKGEEPEVVSQRSSRQLAPEDVVLAPMSCNARVAMLSGEPNGFLWFPHSLSFYSPRRGSGCIQIRIPCVECLQGVGVCIKAQGAGG